MPNNPTPSEDLTEAEIEEVFNLCFSLICGVPVGYAVRDKLKIMRDMAIRAISLPKGERPKRDRTKIFRNAGWKKPDGLGGWTLSGSGVPIESGSWASKEDFETLYAYADALELYADQLEAKLNGGDK